MAIKAGIIAIFATILFCNFQVFDGAYDDFEFNSTIVYTTQTSFVNNYTKAINFMSSEKHTSEVHANSPMHVSGTGDEHIDEILTLYNSLAHHLPTVVDQVHAKYPDADLSRILNSSVDTKIIPSAIIGNAMSESFNLRRGVDVVENGFRGTQLEATWDSLDTNGKIGFLRNTDAFCAVTNPTATQARGNWGYGIFQFTGGRRLALADFWELTGYDMTTAEGQAIYCLYEYTANSDMKARYNHIYGELENNNVTYSLENCKTATDLFYRCNVYGNYKTKWAELPTIPAAIARHDNLDLPSGYGSASIWEVLQAFESGGVMGVKELNNG